MSRRQASWNQHQRPRRLRRVDAIRRMVRETRLHTDNLIAPLFMVEGQGIREPIPSMPGQFRLSVDSLVEEVGRLTQLGIPGVALFPKVPDAKKDPTGSEGLNPQGLFPTAVRALKQAYPQTLVITDVALDPYSSDGHDGLVQDGQILNDETLAVLAKMAVVQADAGADIIAPSDMMDGRVGAIRTALDEAGHHGVAILSYTAKYASALYGPFRDALDSAPRPREGIPTHKQTYQMDPANAHEALREADLDEDEGADMLMVKPAGMYLDVIQRLHHNTRLPIAAYQVSGEYSMLHAAANANWLTLQDVALESLTAIRRAGASIILTYFAAQAAQWLQSP